MSAIDRANRQGANTLAPFFSKQVVGAKRFYLGHSGREHRGLMIGGGVERVSPAYVIDRSGVPFVAMEFVAAGVGSVALRQSRFALTPGSVFTYGPGVPHRITTDERKPMVKYFLDARSAPARKLLKSAGIVIGQVWQSSRPAEMLRLLDELLLNGAARTPFAQIICDRLFEAIIFKSADTRVPLGTAETASFAMYQQCRTIMEQSPAQGKSLNEIANECGITAAYMCRLFQRYDRTTPYQFLLRLRMDRAAAQLRRSPLLVKDVAQAMGFADPFHFSHLFKKTFGVSPAEFRGEH